MALHHDPLQVVRGASAYRNVASGDYLKRTSGLPDPNLFTACGWAVRDVDTNANATLFSIRLAESGGQPHVNLATTAGGDAIEVNANGAGGAFYTIVAGKPFFWAIVGNGTTAEGYVCGLGDPAFATGSMTGLDFAPVVMGLGDRFTTGGEQWNGRFWGTRVWDAILTAVEVREEMMNGGVPCRLRDLHAWWPLEGNVNQLVLDYSGNGRHLTRSGSGRTEKFFLPAWLLPQRRPFAGRVAGDELMGQACL